MVTHPTGTLELHRVRRVGECRTGDAHDAIVDRVVAGRGHVEGPGRLAHHEWIGVLVQHVRGDGTGRARGIEIEWLDGESGPVDSHDNPTTTWFRLALVAPLGALRVAPCPAGPDS